jgi:hypothetical protein
MYSSGFTAATLRYSSRQMWSGWYSHGLGGTVQWPIVSMKTFRKQPDENARWTALSRLRLCELPRHYSMIGHGSAGVRSDIIQLTYGVQCVMNRGRGPG